MHSYAWYQFKVAKVVSVSHDPCFVTKITMCNNLFSEEVGGFENTGQLESKIVLDMKLTFSRFHPWQGPAC